MNDWSHGYEVSLGYTYGFVREMAPDWLDFCALLGGAAAPRAAGAPFRYLDLGVGQGVGLCLLAAACPHGDFVGIDFLPEHVAHAEALAASAGLTNVAFRQADFVDLAREWPDALGSFDYAVLHGVYTWVSPAVRAAVVGCLDHAVRPGGLVYTGYNAQPGWLASAPFQHITQTIHARGGQPPRAALDRSIALFEQLRTGGAETFRFLPTLAPRIEAAKARGINYLAAEYLTDHWAPLWHSQLAGDFDAAGLAFVGPATVAESVLPAPLPPALRAAIAAQDDARLRQDVQDFVINQSFRRDVFRRGTEGAGARDEAAIARVMLRRAVPPAAGAPITFEAAFGEIALQPPAFAQVVAAVAEAPRSIAELAALPDLRGYSFADALQIMLLLLHAGTLAIAAADGVASAPAHRLNAAIARGAAAGLPYDHLAAPALGSAIAARDTELLLLDAWLGGAATAEALGKGLGERLARLGRPSQGDAGALAAGFLAHDLPRWRQLGMAG